MLNPDAHVVVYTTSDGGGEVGTRSVVPVTVPQPKHMHSSNNSILGGTGVLGKESVLESKGVHGIGPGGRGMTQFF